MKQLLCWLAEYYLALYEHDIENGLPGWLRLHLRVCARCQAELQAYRQTAQVVRQYAHSIPDAPSTGWRPLQVGDVARRKTPLLQKVLAPVAVAMVVLAGFALWQNTPHPPSGNADTPPKVAQAVQPPSLPTHPERKPDISPPGKENRTIQTAPKPITAPAPPKPSETPHWSPSPPRRQPPKRIVVASHPEFPTTPAPVADATSPTTDTMPADKSLTAPPVPVQPMVVEAHPIASTPVPEGYVMESARPATTGAFE